MDLRIVFDFLLDLKFNNSRNWFKDNDIRYRNAKLAFNQLVDAIIPQLKQLDNSIDIVLAKECTFRIFRDVRFSKNKEPYKTNFGAFIARGGRKSINAGYYIHFEPDASFIGGGIYMPQPAILKSIRNKIFENSEEYKGIICDTGFKKVFPEIYGERLKLAPKGFPKDFPDIDLLKNKHYAVGHSIDNSFWFENDVINNIMEVFESQLEFNNYLNDAIEKAEIQ